MADTVVILSQNPPSRPLPRWYDEAKFGIFIHWGVFAIPAWAPRRDTPLELSAGLSSAESFFRENPYTEWYWNSLNVDGSPAQRHHREVYDNRPYDDFVPRFREASAGVDLDAWADLFASSGARYVVLVTKHHDGFLLWPSRHPNPHKDGWHTARDMVGDLAAAVRARGLRFGVYYSGGLDWTFGGLGIRDLPTLFGAIPQGDDYCRYADAHYRELIDRYQPAVLWNDIGYPRQAGLDRLIEDYYDAVPDGVINDRFDVLAVNAGTLHADFRCVEYGAVDRIRDHKWEATRGFGNSFGFNRNERDDDLLSVDGLVRLLVDAVSKNGNVLLNVGPAADGTIPFSQASRLVALGWWLRDNGEAVYAVRPWHVAEGKTSAGHDVRFTQTDDAVYAVVLDAREPLSEIVLDLPAPIEFGEVTVLGSGARLAHHRDGSALRVDLPAVLPSGPAVTLRLGEGPRQ